MNETEQTAVMTIALMAAFADGTKDERERAQLRSIADSLSKGSGLDLASIYQDVLLGQRTLQDAARALQTTEGRQLAYELAVCVCDADGAQNANERKFLEAARAALGVDVAGAKAFSAQAEAIASEPVAALPGVADTAGGPAGTTGPATAAGAGAAVKAASAAAAGRVVAAQPADPVALDKSILNYAILNGALELLPQSLASMAIIPLQMKMVYAVGKAYGYELDRGHIKDLLAALGVGLTSQYVEEIGRKLIGGLLRSVGGRVLGGLGRQAVGSAMSFATTYALGHVAKTYYGSGRTLDMEKLKATFQDLLGQGQALRQKYVPEIEQKARTIDVSELLSVVKQKL
jgi:uncharacterized protein (DUF697 family)/tellurite resistance protein